MKTAFAVLLFAAPALATDLQVDPVHSTAGFAIKHMMVSTVRGNFGKVTGTVNYEPKDPTKSSAAIQIDAASLDTRNDKRDKATGDLTMHCVTKPVTLDVQGVNGPVKGPQGATLYALTATGKVNRK